MSYLTICINKALFSTQVDRCVTGLVAQQQCIGPLHTPLADCAIIALSYIELVGSATSIGTQNVKGLLDPAAGARLSLGEALTNLVSCILVLFVALRVIILLPTIAMEIIRDHETFIIIGQPPGLAGVINRLSGY